MLQQGEELCRGTFEELQLNSPEFQLLLGDRISSSLACEAPSSFNVPVVDDSPSASRPRLENQDSNASGFFAERPAARTAAGSAFY
mmetsp:Transcript_9395/g.19329  ORF Transcript_9395/g.19329 Transcript_9395/m.19329 type:complete len:86 (+) Transcript_9395:290-547(+)